MNSLPSTIAPYLRRISESGPFKQTAQAVRFVRRFLTHRNLESTKTSPLTLTFRAPGENTRGRRKTHRAARYTGSASGSASRIFSNGAPIPCPLKTREAVEDGKAVLKTKVPASKALSGARDKLNETKKTRSSISKRVTKVHKGARRKPSNPFSQRPPLASAIPEVETDTMDVDDVSSPTPLPASSPRPLTRSESMVSYSVQTGITVTHSKRKMQRTDSEVMEARLKRLRLSVSMTSSSAPHLPTISPESVLDWIRSQVSVHQLVAERLKAFFVPSSLSEKLHDRRMRKLTPIVNEVASVIPSPYSKDGSQHWLVLKDDVQAKMAPHLQYGTTVAQIYLSRATRGPIRKPEVLQVLGCANRPRRLSPLVNEV